MDLKMEGSYIFTVVFTGLVVVFLGLVILIVCVKIMEQIFKLIDKAKASKKAPAPEKQPEAAKISAPAAPAAGAESRAPAGRAGAATLLKFSLRHLIFVQSIRKKKRERIFQL